MALKVLKLCLALFLFPGCVLANTHDFSTTLNEMRDFTRALTECSPEEAVTCLSGGKAFLDTRTFYEQYHNSECDWTIKNKDGTVIRKLTPAPSTKVECTLPEIHLSINCVIPERIDKCFYYKLKNDVPSYGATRNHIGWEVVVSLCVLWWTYWWWCWN